MVAVTACGVLLFTLPLAWAMAEVYRRGAVVVLQRDAIWAAAEVGSRPAVEAGALAGLDELAQDVDVGLYTPAGQKIAGEGPEFSRVAEMGRGGGFHQGVETGHLAVAAPVVHGGRVEASVRVWMPWDAVIDRWMRTCLLLSALGTVVVALSAVLAWHLARRVAVPLERLTAVARALGDGDFTIQAPRTGIREADMAGQALAVTARRLGEVLERERRFTTAVSHQLRTPLTALVLGLEAAQTAEEGARRAAVATALRRAEHLAETVEELLRLARETHESAAGVDAALVVKRVVERYRATAVETGRTLVVRCDSGLAPVQVAEAAIAQVLGTLLDNALIHGRGQIRVCVVDVGTGVAVEVGDEGPGLDGCEEPVLAERSPAVRRGIGLPLARSLAEAEGGRLVVRRAGPRPVFSLLLPVQSAAGNRLGAEAEVAVPAAGPGGDDSKR